MKNVLQFNLSTQNWNRGKMLSSIQTSPCAGEKKRRSIDWTGPSQTQRCEYSSILGNVNETISINKKQNLYRQ
jgi:hypothetical protein